MAGVRGAGAKRQDRRGTVANGVIERIAEMIQGGDLSPGDGCRLSSSWRASWASRGLRSAKRFGP